MATMPIDSQSPVAGRMSTGDPRDVAIEGEMIRLGQLLKLSGLADSGGEARELVTEGVVRVNGEVETRRGRRLHRGDIVEVDGERVRVA